MQNINQNIPRLEKAFELVKADKVCIKHESVAIVQSMDGTKKYRVDYVREVCECEDSHFRHMRCKHITASQITVGIIKVEK